MEYINSKSADALRKHKRRVHVLEVDTALAGFNVAVSLTNGVFQFPLTECRRELANNDTFTTHMKELHDENINVSICADKQGKKRAFNYDMEMFDFSTGAKRALDNQENIV